MKLRIRQFKTALSRFGIKFSHYNRGFTLIEVIVAMTLMSTTMIAVFFALRTCSSVAHHSRMLSGSVLLAENLIVEALLDEPEAYETTEGSEEQYSWKLQIAPTPVDNLGAVHVQVSWLEQSRQQQYELYSLVRMKSYTERR